jgi:crotonobetainyl-CoA:carnitine CoA-transferase CaiB-like acyl-CoA transferase
MTLPLQGIRIISVEQYGAGPFGTMHLSALGAEIIKVENQSDGGDVSRSVGPYFFSPGDSHVYQSSNLNKKSITLNLKAQKGQEVLHDLVRNSAGVFNNLRGDLPAILGLTYDQLKEVNPAIVCAHLSAYGRTGSRAAWPGYDYLMQAEVGYLSLTGEPGGPPARFGVSIVDMMTGVTAVLGLLAGIIGARATGIGRDVDVSLFDVALHNLNYLATWYLNEGMIQGQTPRSGHPSLVPSQLYRTKDGWIFIMCNKEKFWKELASAIGKPEWQEDPRFHNFEARLANRDLLTRILDEVLMTATTQEWMEKLGGKVPVAPVNDVGSALENPFVKEQGMLMDVPNAVRGTIGALACPIRCPGETALAAPGPGLGEHTDEILHQLNYSKEKIEKLRDEKII